jgi:acetyl-CoA carboxylase biotin carboxylase subunit
MKISKILIANRGEIAVRIIRTVKKMGIIPVAIYSEVDAEGLHVSLANEAYCLGHSQLADTYLNIEKIVTIALESGCQAVHPGYGFLAENPDFVSACKQSGLIFIGPDTRAMQVMGNKIAAREFVGSIGVPVTKGLTGDTDYLLQHASEIGFPVLVKAAAGGGGKGMRIVRSPEELEVALESTSREAANYFADGTVYIEKYFENPRHIEFQLLGDQKGNMVHLFERECSIQRRYQKIIEEAPSPTLTPEVRKRMGEAAVEIGKAIGYSNAGTIEFLVDQNLDFYFLEMNTRIQVEHPVTELTTGIDIVEEQIRIACGESLRFEQVDLRQHGHAIECRIYAEDPENNFMPSPGKMSLYLEPSGEYVRVDSGIAGNPVIHSFFDPMIAKLIVWGEDRNTARARITEALFAYQVHGIKSNISYLLAILNHPVFINNAISTKYCDEHMGELKEVLCKAKSDIGPEIPLITGLIATLKRVAKPDFSVWNNIGYWRNLMQPILMLDSVPFRIELISYSDHYLDIILNDKRYSVDYHLFEAGKVECKIAGKHYLAWVSLPEKGRATITHSGYSFEVVRTDVLPLQQEFSNAEQSGSGDHNEIVAPMPGKVIKILVTEGQPVEKGDLLLVVEAMKMENNILSPRSGVVESIAVAVGDLVDGNKALVELKG